MSTPAASQEKKCAKMAMKLANSQFASKTAFPAYSRHRPIEKESLAIGRRHEAGPLLALSEEKNPALERF